MTLISPNRGLPLQRIDYDDGALGRVHSRLGDVADSGTDLAAALASIHAGLEGRGQAISDVTTDAGELESGIRETLETLALIADAVRGYHDTATTHAAAANSLISDIEWADLQARWAQDAHDAAQRQVDILEDAGVDRVVTASYEGQRDAAADAAVAAAAQLAELWERWEAAYARWDEGYDAAVAALAHVDAPSADPALRRAVDLLAAADGPAAVAAVWASLSDAERAALLADRPAFIGNLEGVPYATRFAANRAVLTATVAQGPYGEPLDSQFAELGREVGSRRGELLFFRPFEQPQATAAVVYGVTRDADGGVTDPFAGVTHVTTLVGGMFSGLGDLSSWGASARDLNTYVNAYGDAGTSSVTIAWYGYDSPDFAGEPFMGSAREGAARLAETLRGLDAEVTGSVTTTVIGHSYGSTTAFLAVGSAGATGSNLGVDRLIAIGSAGIATSADGEELEYPGVDVFASRADGDIVARLGEHSSFGHRGNPEDIPGAVRFESDGGWAPALGGGSEEVEETPGHAAHDGGNSFWGWWEKGNGYLSTGSESFRNMASIVADGRALG